MVDLSNMQIVKSIPLQITSLNEANNLQTARNTALSKSNDACTALCCLLGVGLLVTVGVIIYQQSIINDLRRLPKMAPDNGGRIGDL